MARHGRRVLRLEKPRGIRDRVALPKTDKEPYVTGGVVLNIGDKKIPIPILSSQDELNNEIVKLKKFLKKKFFKD